MNKLRNALQRMVNMHTLVSKKINWGSSFFDAECIREMNEAPGEAAKALAETDMWKRTADTPPPIGEPLLGYSPVFVDEDFNPDGIRECHAIGDGTEFSSARWNNDQDCWETTEDKPTHWMLVSDLVQTPWS